MVRYGFIHTKEDIKFLVLFAMDLLPFPVSFSTIVDLTTWCDEGFGYFELSEASTRWSDRAHRGEYPTKENPVRHHERDASYPHFEKQLPYPVREAAQRSALRVVRQIRRDAHPHRRHRARPERPDRPHGNGAGVRSGNERRQSRTGCHARAYL